MIVDWQQAVFPLLRSLTHHLMETLPLPGPNSSIAQRRASWIPLSGSITLQPTQPVITPATQAVDKLPSFIQFASLFPELVLQAVPLSAVQVALGSSGHLGNEVQSILTNTVTRLLEACPASWKKVVHSVDNGCHEIVGFLPQDLLTDKLRRLAVDTPFGNFIGDELSKMNKDLQVIVTSLQVIGGP